ncbi:putative N-acetylmannosamine-6-phosphate 2-epimerase [Leptothrix sp. BB-4]
MNDDLPLQAMQPQLVVSCQPLPGSAMDQPEILLAMALAAVAGGAAALRIEGVDNVRRVAARVDVPVIGYVRRALPDTPVCITPWLEDVDALADAGAAIVAFDATRRVRPVKVAALIARIHAHGCLAMAGSADPGDGLAAWTLGAELLATAPVDEAGDGAVADLGPDLDLVRTLAGHGCRVVAEGNIRSPRQAAEAIAAGARCVTIGSGLTCIGQVTAGYADALRDRSPA